MKPRDVLAIFRTYRSWRASYSVQGNSQDSAINLDFRKREIFKLKYLPSEDMQFGGSLLG